MAFKKENFEYNDNFENFSEKKDIYSSSDKKINKRSHINYKKIRKRKIIFSFAIIISIVLGLAGSALIYAYKMLDSLNYNPIENSSSDFVSSSAQDPMILNVALFGVDKHDETDIRSRSDSILILSLDSRHKKIKLTSLMRDMWVNIPGYKDNRINTAIALGGEPLAIKTIEHNFGIKIDRYCTVDFEGFKDIIDIIGGLDINITAKEAHHINRLLVELDDAFVKGGLTPFKSPLLKEVDGVQHLNGAQSLQYARSRKVPTAEGLHDDYARTFRQRKVISLVVDKFKSSSLPQIISIIEKVGPYINTNLKKNEIITLGKNVLKYLKYELTEFRLPQEGNFEGKNINGASVLVISDLNKARYELAKYIYEEGVKESVSVKTTPSAQNSNTSTAKTISSSTSNNTTSQQNSNNSTDSSTTETKKSTTENNNIKKSQTDANNKKTTTAETSQKTTSQNIKSSDSTTTSTSKNKSVESTPATANSKNRSVETNSTTKTQDNSSTKKESSSSQNDSSKESATKKVEVNKKQVT